MTTIAAVSINGTAAIAADGYEIWNDVVTSRGTRKLFCEPDMFDGPVIAAAGNAKNLNFFDTLDWAQIAKLDFIWKLVGLLERWFKDKGYNPADHKGSTQSYGQQFLLLDGSDIWEIHPDLQYGKLEESQPVAIGSGCEFAIGAMEAMLRLRPESSAAEVAREGVLAGIRRDVWSGGKIMMAARGDRAMGPSWCCEVAERVEGPQVAELSGGHCASWPTADDGERSQPGADVLD